MQTKLLFPHRYRLIGWVIFVPAALLGLAAYYAEFQIAGLAVKGIGSSISIKSGPSQTNLLEIQNLTDELATLGIIIGLLLIAFSREKIEDEMISQLRLRALQWGLLVNYVVLMLATVLVYDFEYFQVLTYNMFTPLLVFIVRFRWLLRRMNVASEEVAA